MPADINCLEKTEPGHQDEGWPKAENYDERSYQLGIFCLRLRGTRSGLIGTFEIVKRIPGIKCEELFTHLPDRGHLRA